jgi:small subunit ribosomal protein S2
VAQITIKDLLESGVHFGHQTRRWNPKMKKFIFTERNGIYIIDLQKTLSCITRAADAVREISARGEAILFVGTKPQAAVILKEEAERCGQFFVNTRWLGGMLTNFRTIRLNVKRLDHLDKMAADGTYEHLTKKEALNIDKQRDRLGMVLGGIRELGHLPGLLVVVDTKKEKIAVSEAVRLGIPICAILDTNSDPDPITYPIPGNDDAIRSIKLILSQITDSIIEGAQLRVDRDIIAEKERGLLEAEGARINLPEGEEAPATEAARGDRRRSRHHKPREEGAEEAARQQHSVPRARPPKRREPDGKV